MRATLMILLCVLIFIGCNQQDKTILSSEQSNSGTESLLKPPAQSGPYVIRGEGLIAGLLYAVSDGRRGMSPFLLYLLTDGQ